MLVEPAPGLVNPPAVIDPFDSTTTADAWSSEPDEKSVVTRPSPSKLVSSEPSAL